MNSRKIDILEMLNRKDRLDYQKERDEAIRNFVETNPDYYIEQFSKIGRQSKFTITYNCIAGILGPVWFGARGLWSWALAFLIIETVAFVQIIRGLFGDLSAEAWARIASIENTLDLRRQQLASAIEKSTEKIDVYRRAVVSLESNIESIKAEAVALDGQGIWIALAGILLLILAKLSQSIFANWALERLFSEWRSNPEIRLGFSISAMVISAIFMILISIAAIMHYSFPNYLNFLAEFPTDASFRLIAIGYVEQFFEYCVINGEAFFDAITRFIRIILDTLETLFVGTPWIVVACILILLTHLSAGPRMAIYTTGFLSYMGFLGFWEKAMTTLALLGTAACLSIIIGIPLGMFCARRKRLYSFIQPIMDFMQTMPAFVFMIPVIAFFGTGKPAAVVTTMIFGGTPVVRLTVLGLRGVPESVREAAVSFGAGKWYLLTKVDLPLAAPSIRAGINQTIMLSLAMVVVASLIGAKGLGEDVLEALQYANVGQGILAGFCILFCAMILDRIVQGGNR